MLIFYFWEKHFPLLLLLKKMVKQDLIKLPTKSHLQAETNLIKLNRGGMLQKVSFAHKKTVQKMHVK